MNFEEKPLMDTSKNDPFWLQKFIFMDIFKKKRLRWILIFGIVMHSFKHCLSLWYFHRSHKLFVQYSPMMFGEVYMLVATASTLIYRRRVEEILDSVRFWTLDSCSRETQTKNQEFIRKCLVPIYIALISGSLMGALVLIPDRTDRDFIFSLWLFENKFPQYSQQYSMWFALVHKLSLGPLLCSLLVHPFMIMYSGQHLHVQAEMYKELLRNLTGDFDISPDLIDDADFQSTVQKRLRFCIERHVEFLLLVQITNKYLIGPLLPVLIIGGYFFSLSVFLVYYGVQAHVYEMTLRNVLVMIGFGLIVVIACWALFSAGQLFEDDTEKMQGEFQNLDWYVWNRQNKMALLMMLTRKAIGFRFTSELAVNHSLGMKMYRGIYSVVSLIATSTRN